MVTGSRLGSWSARAALCAVAVTCLAKLASGCDPLGNLGNLDFDFNGNGGGIACPDAATALPSPSPSSSVSLSFPAEQALCQKLEQCFPQVFAASYGDAAACEISFWSGLPIGCQPTSQCLMDLMSAPCPACLTPPMQNGSALIASPTAFLPQSCQTPSVIMMLAGFGNLDVQDAACGIDSEPPATLDDAAFEADAGALEAGAEAADTEPE